MSLSIENRKIGHFHILNVHYFSKYTVYRIILFRLLVQRDKKVGDSVFRRLTDFIGNRKQVEMHWLTALSNYYLNRHSFTILVYQNRIFISDC